MKFLEINKTISKTRISKTLYTHIREYAVNNNLQIVYDDMRRAVNKKSHWAIPFTKESKNILSSAVIPSMLSEKDDEKVLNGLLSLQSKLHPQQLTESKKKSKRREYDHLEDLLFFEGLEGVDRIGEILKDFTKQSKDLTIKFDGMPTVYFGREPNGQFVLVGKNGWGKNKSLSAKNLHSFVLSTGKGEDWRQDLANSLSGIWKYLEEAMPTGFRGYVYGDLLFFPTKPVKNSQEGYIFTPNQVTYTVDPNSDIGQRLTKAKVGVVLHNTFGSWGDTTPKKIGNVNPFNSNQVLALGPTYISDPPNVDMNQLAEVEKIAMNNSRIINQLIRGQHSFIADIPNVLYRFTNYMSKSNKLDKINEDHFWKWIEGASFSKKVREGVKKIGKSEPGSFKAVFELYTAIMKVKDNIITQLDNQQTAIKASTGENAGGEGYISNQHKIKLVPRHRWKPHI